MAGFNIIVDEQGNVEITTVGYQGEACAADVERLIAELAHSGVKVIKRDSKAIPQNVTAHRTGLRA